MRTFSKMLCVCLRWNLIRDELTMRRRLWEVQCNHSFGLEFYLSLSPVLHTLKVAENVEMKFRIKCERDFVQLIFSSDFSSFLWSKSGRLIELWHIYGNFYTINFITLCALQSPRFWVIFDEWIWDEWINNESHYQRPSLGDVKCNGTNSRNFVIIKQAACKIG